MEPETQTHPGSLYALKMSRLNRGPFNVLFLPWPVASVTDPALTYTITPDTSTVESFVRYSDSPKAECLLYIINYTLKSDGEKQLHPSSSSHPKIPLKFINVYMLTAMELCCVSS